MPSDRSFKIMTRIAIAEGAIVFGLLLYLLQLSSIISPMFTLLGGIIVTIMALILIFISERITRVSVVEKTNQFTV
jgi:hypothetical protein